MNLRTVIGCQNRVLAFLIPMVIYQNQGFSCVRTVIMNPKTPTLIPGTCVGALSNNRPTREQNLPHYIFCL
jgi:hypothetical protein